MSTLRTNLDGTLFISVLTFILVCFFLLACGSEATSLERGRTPVSKTPSVSTPTPRPTATQRQGVRNLGNIGAVVGSTLDAFIHYFHRQPDDHDQPQLGTRYAWLVSDVGPMGDISEYDVEINKDGVVIDVNIIFSHYVKYGVCAAFIPKDGKIQGKWKKEDLDHLYANAAPNVMVVYQSNTLSKLPPEDFSASQTILQTNSKRGSATVEIVSGAGFSHCDIYLGTS